MAERAAYMTYLMTVYGIRRSNVSIFMSNNRRRLHARGRVPTPAS